MYYISYGSNMNVGQMAFRCPNTKIYGNGKLFGWKLVFNYHADIVETGNKDDFVPVVVWKLDDQKDEYSLDRYEGYPSYYTKILTDVIMDTSGEKLKAMVYVMAESRKGIYPPTVDYFDCIREGYIANNIELSPLYEAVQECCDETNLTKYNQYNPKPLDIKELMRKGEWVI